MTRDEFSEFFRVVLPDVLEEIGSHPQWPKTSVSISYSVRDRAKFPDHHHRYIIGILSEIIRKDGRHDIADVLDEAAKLELEPATISGRGGTIRFNGGQSIEITGWCADYSVIDESINEYESILIQSPSLIDSVPDTGPSLIRKGLAGWLRDRVPSPQSLGSQPTRRGPDSQRKESRRGRRNHRP